MTEFIVGGIRHNIIAPILVTDDPEKPNPRELILMFETDAECAAFEQFLNALWDWQRPSPLRWRASHDAG